MGNQRWKQRPPGSNWGDFGPDDRLGCLNYLTHEKVLQAISEVREGLSFCLSIPLDYPGGNGLNPNRYPPILRPNLRKGMVNFNCRFGEIEPGRTDVLSDDLVILYLQYSTQWDGLAHAGSLFDADGDGVPEPVYYNGYNAKDYMKAPPDATGAGITDFPLVSSSSALALGIEHMAEKAVQGRGVMIDLKAHFGEGRTLVGYDEMMQVLEKDCITVEKGDILCLHTGFAERVLSMKKQPDHDVLSQYGAALNGRDLRLQQWITDTKIAAIAADNYAVEQFPAPGGGDCCAALPLHELCLFKLGLHLGELWRLTPLAGHLRAQGRHYFFLTAPPLNLPGAIASPLTPVATV